MKLYDVDGGEKNIGNLWQFSDNYMVPSTLTPLLQFLGHVITKNQEFSMNAIKMSQGNVAM